jgi:hypothetical protein
MNIRPGKYQYSQKKEVSDRRKDLLSQIPYEEYIKQKDLEATDRDTLNKDLKALAKSGHIRKSVQYGTAIGEKMFRRVVG